ncbi:outer membrane protein assembly factor BamB family protein [Haloarcula halophila]|uniref:outer membrane protein assembly factor BamB family protein n=1 Tax=Haloarcula TaxID=2237 RepID=UPI0023E35ED7|nr:PQQ-binding-like beta-propeller repeat protein [Halomicroarcula sp. DFY41]
MRETVRRRTFLTAVATTAVGLAGCGGDSDDDRPTATDAVTDTPVATATDTATATETATPTQTPQLLPEADWPSYHYSAGNLGVHPEATGLSGPPATSWTYDLGTPTEGSLTLVDGTLFVGAGSLQSSSDAGAIHAIDAVSGDQQWRAATDGPVHATPVHKEGFVFAGTDTGTMYALNGASGEEFWTYSPSSGAGFGTAHVADGTVIVGTGGGRVLELQQNSGGRTGQTDVTAEVRTAIARVRGVTYVGTNSGSVFALADSAADSWEYDEGRGIRGVATDGRAVYATSRDGKLLALNTNGRLIWEFGTASPVRHNPVIDGEWAFFGTDSGEIYGLEDGLERWKTELDTALSNAPVLVAGTLYVVANDGTVYALDRATGSVNWSHALDVPVERSTPIVSGGRLWVPTLAGTVHAIGG